MYPSPKNFVFYLKTVENTLEMKPASERIMLPPDLVFIWLRYLQPVGFEWRGWHYFPYHLWLLPKDVQRSATAFAYDTGLSITVDRKSDDAVDVKEK